MNSEVSIKITYKDYLIHGIYFFLYGIVKYFPSPIGDKLRRWVTLPFIDRIGKARIYEGVTFWYPYRINIGNHVSINEWCYLSGYGGIEIQDHVRIGHRCSFITSNHVIDDLDIPIHQQGLNAAPITIEENVWIGCNVTILPGVNIGKGSVVAAGAVVTKSIPEYSIVAGVPAKVIKNRQN